MLERYATLLAGGENGAVVVAGKSDESRLIQVLTGKAKPAMPPEDNEKPTAAEIATLAAWIDAGAKGPDGAEPDPTVLVTPKIKPRGERRARRSPPWPLRPTARALAVARFEHGRDCVRLPERSIGAQAGADIAAASTR